MCFVDAHLFVHRNGMDWQQIENKGSDQKSKIRRQVRTKKTKTSRFFFFFFKHAMLDLAGMELIFFTADHMVLGFGCVTTTVLITRQCFRHCWTLLRVSRPSPFLTLSPLWVAYGWTRGWEGTQLGQLTKEVFHTLVSRLAIRLRAVFSPGEHQAGD